jgi:hypothetical protein
VVPAIARSNLELYAQLRRAGWPPAEIETIGRAHRLGTDLLTGQYRANGRSLLDHFVGTASLVAALDEGPTLVRAALLHNVYTHGVWTSGRPGPTPRRRREVRSVLGTEAEELVCAYESFAFWDDDIAALVDQADPIEGRTRDLVLLRLANEVEDRQHLGFLHSHQHRRPLAPMIALANRLVLAPLADGLQVIGREEAEAVVEPGLVADPHGGYLLAPRSHRRRLVALAYGTHRQVRRMAGRGLRAVHLR